ncbi:MAG TPA: transketolase [Ignavibacteriales bacterium]|nr:transketolase [Ignavibacteriales bacterium]
MIEKENKKKFIEFLKNKATWVRRETLKIHKIAPGIRLASALSCVEILTVLYYGKVLNYNPKEIYSEERDRFIISKAHGSVSFYPILADLGFFDKKELGMVGKAGSILGDIPDCSIPGYETVNGSLGHGLGVACGIALALKKKNRKEKVFALSGDGELHEGSVWEAIMFAAHHNLNNLVLIIDNNKICMLDYCANILNLEPIDAKFKVFKWQPKIVDGHNVEELYGVLSSLKADNSECPKVVIANTIKGKGVPRLETDSLCHIKALNTEEIDKLLSEMV